MQVRRRNIDCNRHITEMSLLRQQGAPVLHNHMTTTRKYAPKTNPNIT